MIWNPFIHGILILFLAAPHPTAGWTLDETVGQALDISGNVAIEKFSAREAALDARNAASRWYPQVSFSASANVVSEVMELALPQRTVRFGDYDSYDFTLSVTQTLYDGGRLAALRQAGDARARMSTSHADAARLGVAFAAKTSFFRVILAERLLGAVEQSREETLHHLTDTQSLRGQGMAIENDVVRAQLRVSNADMAVASQNAELARSRAAFRSVTGMAPDEPVVLEWEGSYEPHTGGREYGSLVESRPEFDAFDAAEEASRHAAMAAHAGLLPAVGLSAGFHYGRPGLDLPANEWMHYASAGIRLNWNVWDWGTTSREEEQSRISTLKVRASRDDFARELKCQLTEARTAYDEARKRLELARKAASYAETNLGVVSAAYREGMMTETDYDNAHTAFTRAEIEASAVEVSVWIGAAQIEYVLGIGKPGGTDE